MTTKQKTAMALVGAAMIMLLFSMLTKKWFRIDYGQYKISIGLLSVEQCGDQQCSSDSLKEVFREDDMATYVLASKATFVLGLVSAVALAVLALLGLKRRDATTVMGKITLLILILTVLGSIIVMAKKPHITNASLGVFLFMLGGMAGVIGAQMLSTSSTYEQATRDPSIPRL